MTIKFLTMALTLASALVVTGSTARAARPLDVDCEALAETNECVNEELDEEGVQFDNLGDLISSALHDEEVFDTLDALILLCSEGDIDFESASQAVSTNARCGLIPQIIRDISD